MKTKLFFILSISVVLLFTDCKKKKEESPQPYVSFTIGSVTYTFNSASSFNKICILSDFCGSFSLNTSQADRNHIFIGFPSDVTTGKSYQTGDSHFEFVYNSPDAKQYTSHQGGHMLLNISIWEGNGGWVKGTFSGSLPLEGDPLHDSVVIQNGKFEGKIWYIQTR
ncbi:MAG: hypothetical protein D4R67_08305 [Bacteroidetes bacterium]|nr:MAG: hypothetical protein D4R67_08305 [Bacteroidota bacterium]